MTTPAKKTAKRAYGETQAILNDDLGIERLCDMILAGNLIEEICRELGVGHASLIDWVAKDEQRSKLTKEARIHSARTFEEKAEQVIRDAADPFQLAKAKELAHHYRWRASKIAPRDYGDKVAIGGADDLPPIKTVSDEQLLARIKRLQDKMNDADKG